MVQTSVTGKKIFITDGAGFVGVTLIERLIDNNKITVYDNFRRDALGAKQYSSHPNLRIVKGDVRDYASLKDAMEDAQYVIHCAAIVGIDTVIKKPTETMRINMVGTANMLEAAKSLHDLHRFVDFSTSEVFGQIALVGQEYIAGVGDIL